MVMMMHNKQLIEFSSTEEFLRRWCPRDLLMPVKKGTKHPVMPHSGGRWSWDKLEEWKRLNPSDKNAGMERYERYERCDACILMSDLCVIDVDDEEIALRLESKFPILHDVPMERTRRGRHYWFRRSQEADLFGYYDGHGQREKGIDFKTKCRTGTGGVVVIAPSSGKTWEKDRALNNDALVPIPFDLLDAVARPLHRIERHRFLFCDRNAVDDMDVQNDSSHHLSENFERHSVEMDTIGLAAISYFEPFIRSEQEEENGYFVDSEGAIRVPCAAWEFETLMRVLFFSPTSKDRWTPPPSAEEWSTAIRTGDMLGLDTEIDLYAKMAHSTTLWWHDLRNRWPEMASAIDREHAYRRWEGVDDSISIELVDGNEILYDPLKKKKDEDLSLFAKSGPRSRYVGGISTVIDAGAIQRTKSQLPESVKRLVDEFPLVLAGGSVLGMLASSGVIDKGHDYDLFVYGLDDGAADRMLQTISEEILPRPAWRLIQTPNAWTFVEQERRIEGPPYQHVVPFAPVVIQVILRLYRNPHEVAVGFDIAASRVALWKSPKGEITVRATPSWFETMRRLTILVEPFEGIFSRATTMRVVKYAGKGFDVWMPGLRKAFANQNASIKTKDDLRKLRGVRSIVYVDQCLDGRWPTRAIRENELSRIMRSMRTVVSEYAEEELKITDRIKRIVTEYLSWVCMRVAKRIFGQRRTDRNAFDELSEVGSGGLARMTLWRKFRDRQPSEFKPESPCLRNLHLEQDEEFEIACCDALGIEPRTTTSLTRRIEVALVQSQRWCSSAIEPEQNEKLIAFILADIHREVFSRNEEDDPALVIAAAQEAYRRVYAEVCEEMDGLQLPRRDYIRLLVRRAITFYFGGGAQK